MGIYPKSQLRLVLRLPRNPCCAKETKNLTQFFQVSYLCQQNKKLNVIIKREAREKAKGGGIRLLGLSCADYSERVSPGTFIPYHLHVSKCELCLESVPGGG